MNSPTSPTQSQPTGPSPSHPPYLQGWEWDYGTGTVWVDSNGKQPMTTPALPIGRRVCRDCKTAIPPERMYRCAECLVKRLDRKGRR